ncbi:MAG: NUDIX domain-containing protein [Thermomicrobiales bacterium]
MSRFFVNVEAVIWRQGRFLVIERGPEESFGAGWLAFPGGKADWNGEEANTVEHTACRELAEEVGLIVGGPWHFVESKSFGIGSDPVLDIVMLARYETGDPTIVSPGEVASVAWLTPAEIEADPRTQPWTLVTLQKLVRAIADLDWEHSSDEELSMLP